MIRMDKGWTVIDKGENYYFDLWQGELSGFPEEYSWVPLQ